MNRAIRSSKGIMAAKKKEIKVYHCSGSRFGRGSGRREGRAGKSSDHRLTGQSAKPAKW